MEPRVCVITGGGQGIGRALSHHFAEMGVRVVVAEMTAQNAAQVAEEIAAKGGEALAVHTDVSNAASVRDLFAQVRERYGRVDILINNARWSGLAPTPVQDISDADWQRAMNVNVTGAFHCVREAAPMMIAAGWGRIINMSSATIRQPPAQPYVHYITSKAALVGMTRALARELGQHGITVNAILPGSIETGVARPSAVTSEIRAERAKTSQAIPRVIAAADLAGAAFFLASDAAAFITGQSLAVDGGFSYG